MNRARVWALMLVVALALAALTGCGAKEEKLPAGAAANDILTFQNNADNRPIVRVGMQSYSPRYELLEALREKFPDYLFVPDMSCIAGTGSETRIYEAIEKGETFDLLVTNRYNYSTKDMQADFYDLSAQSFLNRYQLSTLSGVSIGGHIYQLPGVSSLAGVAFNVEMFREHGWAIPKSYDEFLALCAEIEAAGIQPFSTCCKYPNQLSRLLTTMSYANLYGTGEGAAWLAGERLTFQGGQEPLFALAKRLVDAGVIREEYFTASLTQQRKDFFAGRYAMIDYDSVIFTYAESEGAPFTVGIMPYPAQNADDAGFALLPESYLSLPAALEKNPERLALMLKVLDFISTEEGQNALLAEGLSISSIKGVPLSDNAVSQYAAEAYEKGNLYPLVQFGQNDSVIKAALQNGVRSLFGGVTAERAAQDVDSALAEAYQNGAEAEAYETIATAESDFTMLETSCYVADKLREAAGADVGLMINCGYFVSNLAKLYKGDVTANMSRFVMKGVGAEDYLTTYRMTGAQLKAMLETPVVNGAETDAFVAASGLWQEYAPWNERGSRLQKLTLAGGAEVRDDQLYTVAAWKGAVADQYVTETVQTHDALGTLTEIVEKAIRADKVLKPDAASHVTLVWPKGK